MTLLIAGGDSFTFGSELPSGNHAWSALLAERMNMEYLCTALPAASNSSIRRRVINAVHQHKHRDLFVAVMWSFPNRYEFRFAYDTVNYDSPWCSINPWTINDQNPANYFFNKDDKVLQQQLADRAHKEKIGMSDFARSYVHNVAQTEYWEIYNSWCEIVMLQNYLIKHNIDYIFTYVDNSLFENNSGNDLTLTAIQEDIDMSKFLMDEGMFNWAKRTNQQFYTTHPTEAAHIIWINTLYDRIHHGHN